MEIRRITAIFHARMPANEIGSSSSGHGLKLSVVSGKGVIRFRKIERDEVIEYFVSGEKLEVVDIPVGYTHNIENLGDTDMVTFMWCNECFNPEKPDTFFEEV